ncbi:invasion protein IalB [Streptosporangium album]|uniref:Invasion protein IalB n=1 Tax=Streptosporangium album TaxID=47479 RepID=A0A7W7S0E9_9ACTN|nr:hypothetical protein [Streptosporangium album]MBB4941599.1 invasion protein IalB [Streptosporangium album]
MKHMRKLAVAVAATSVAAGLVLAPTAASASQSSALGCQGASATLHYYYYTSSGSIGDWTKNCSGSYSLNSAGFRLYSGGWSGYISFNDSTTKRFCDWQDIPLNKKRVTGIYLSATRASWC